MTTKIYLVRHAQPNLNNHDDEERELSQKGLQDCQLVDQFFKDISLDQILSSPYRRAYDTIRHLAQIKQVAIQVDSYFRERKITNEWIADFNGFAQKQWQDFSFKLAHGESLQEVQDRMLEGLTVYLQNHQEETLVIASHGTAISCLIHYYCPQFSFVDFEAIKDLMPFVVELIYEQSTCLSIKLYNLFTGETTCYL